MAQAYEYQTIGNTNPAMLESDLATEDAAGWDVIGFSTSFNGATATYFALLRRRV